MFRRSALKRDDTATTGTGGAHTATTDAADQAYYRDDEPVVMIELRDDANQIIRAQPLLDPEVIPSPSISHHHHPYAFVVHDTNRL